MSGLAGCGRPARLARLTTVPRRERIRCPHGGTKRPHHGRNGRAGRCGHGRFIGTGWRVVLPTTSAPPASTARRCPTDVDLTVRRTLRRCRGGGERPRRAAQGGGEPRRRVRRRRQGERDAGRGLRAPVHTQPAPDLPGHPGRAAAPGRRGCGGIGASAPAPRCSPSRARPANRVEGRRDRVRAGVAVEYGTPGALQRVAAES